MAIYMWREQQGWQPGANTIAYWQFENNLNDTSGTSPTYNLTANTATVSYSAGISGNCVDKGGTGYLESTLNCNLFTGNFTLMFFIKFSSISAVVRLMGEASNFTNIQYESGNGGLQWYNNNEAGRTKWNWTPIANTWYHIAITGDGSSYTAYLDGTAMTKTKQGTIASGSTGFVLGGNSAVNSTNFVGAFDEVIIENKVRTAQEVADYVTSLGL